MTFASNHLRRIAIYAAVLLISAPLFAFSKETDKIQFQIQQLQDTVARLQQSNDERMGVMKDLVQQNADSVNKMSATMDSVARSLQTQNEAQSGKLDQLSGQIQLLNDSLDEMKTRLARLEKLTQDIQNQQQSINPISAANTSSAAPVSQPQPESALPATPPTNADTAAPVARRGKPSAATPLASSPAPAAAPPVDEVYKAALGDYMAAKYSLSAGEFADVIRYYPDNPLAGNSFYYLGEIDYRAAKYDEAAKDYDMVLDHFPANNKVPATRLHKGQALLALKRNDAAVREFRALIQRFPNSPEASLARSKLSGLGIAVAPRR